MNARLYITYVWAFDIVYKAYLYIWKRIVRVGFCTAAVLWGSRQTKAGQGTKGILTRATKGGRCKQCLRVCVCKLSTVCHLSAAAHLSLPLARSWPLSLYRPIRSPLHFKFVTVPLERGPRTSDSFLVLSFRKALQCPFPLGCHVYCAIKAGAIKVDFFIC